MFTALAEPGTARIGAISDAFGISRNHLVKVVHFLGKTGYLATKRGAGGGFSLALAPNEIRLDILVRRTESNLHLVECFSPAENTCRLSGACRLKGILFEAQESFFKTLRRYTLADLVESPTRMKALLTQ